MEPLKLARSLAVANAVLDGVVVALVQRTYDDPRRLRRYAVQGAVGLGVGVALMASDAAWNRATRDRTPPVDPEVTPLPEAMATIRHLSVAAAWVPVWWIGRGLPERMRRNGNATPNATLALPLAVVFAASTLPVEWVQARDRVAALTP